VLNRWPYNTTSFRLVLIALALFIWLVIETFHVKAADAASLRICYENTLSPGVATVEARTDTAILYTDILANSIIESRCVGGPVDGDICTAPSTCQTGQCKALRCATRILPTIPRGQDIPVTLRAFNTLGEGGPASAPVTFFAPAIPGAVTGTTIQIIVP
jgi:hypothetical protein